MPKLIAPHGASWRGRALGPGDIVDVSDAEAFHLAPHGFRILAKLCGGFDAVVKTLSVL